MLAYFIGFAAQIFSKGYSDDIDSGYGIPSKQVQQHFSHHPVVYQKHELPFFDSTPVKSSKYSELFNNPVAPSPGYGFSSGVDMYPVDVVNSIPSSTSTGKYEASSNQQTGSASNNVDLDSMIFGKADMDFGSLFSMLNPDNKLSDSQATDSSSYLIPNLDFLSEPSPQQPEGSNGYQSTGATNMQPFGQYDMSVIENANVITQVADERSFWEGGEKDATELVMSPPTHLPLSLDGVSPMDDPFITELFGDETVMQFPADDSRYDQTATPSSDVFPAGPADVHSPTSMSAQPSPVTPANGGGEATPRAWDDNLQDLFQKTVDLSDMMELDFMLPPPTKRRTGDNLPLYESHSVQEREDIEDSDHSPREVKVEPHSPEVKEVKSPALTSPIAVDATSERGGGGKSKSTILFGKHEDEIIHKLLAPRPGAANKPVSRDKLVSMPVEEFNQLLEQASLSEIEVAFMKEWRRRGKNKAAAQIARKRKREEVTDLEGEVKALRKQKAELNRKYDRLRSQIATLKKKSMAAEDKVYRQQTKLTGKTVSRDTHLIHLTDDNRLLLVPRISSQVLTINK